MSSSTNYDAIVAVDDDGDLGHTDLQEDLEFHPSEFTNTSTSAAGRFNKDTGSKKSGGAGVHGKLSTKKGKSGGGGPLLPAPATHDSGGVGGGNASGGGAAGSGGKQQIWRLQWWAQFFDVDTSAVLARCGAALWPRANFLDVLEGNPDLYGPLWIATTVVLILFLGGTISAYLADTNKTTFAYDFRLLSGAAGLIYGYTLFAPLLLYLGLHYFGADGAALLESWALYGYANAVWVPVALAAWSPVPALNWALVGAGCALSLVFLLRNLLPVLSSAAHPNAGRCLLLLVVAAHLGLALAIKILFFAHGSPVARPPGHGGPGKIEPPPPENGGDGRF